MAFLALYWARYRGYSPDKRDRLFVMGLTHDLHESATGDILPGLKNPDLTKRLEEIQRNFMEGLEVAVDKPLEVDLKALDMIAFLFEIRQAAVANQEQRGRLAAFFHKQRALLLAYCGERGIAAVEEFLREMGVDYPEGP